MHVPEIAHLPLRAFEALFDPERDGDPLLTIIRCIHGVFAFDQAVVLESDGDSWKCAAAFPRELSNLRWLRGPFFEEIAAGRISATYGNHDLQEWREVSRALIAPTQPALYLPMGVHGHRGLLILLRSAGKDAFTETDITLARQFALIALAAFAARGAANMESELSELRGQVERLRAGDASRSSDLLKRIFEHLPFGLTVQDQQGRFILVNDVAAARFGLSPAELTGRPPADCPGTDLLQATQEISQPQDIGAVDLEEQISGPAGERTWLTSRKPMRVRDEPLLLSSSIDITWRKQLERDLARRAYTDELTGLPNRAMIQERVDDILGAEAAECFALAFIDLDNFKHINDYYNHAVGDALLVRVARRIADLVRETDMLARISGDEFLLLVHPIESDDHVRTVVESLLEKLKQPFHVEGFEMFTSASIGVSIYPEHGRAYEELRRNADSAMYRAKSGAKGAAAFFDVAVGRAISARMEMEQRLRLAIRDRQFCCAFQPKVDIRNQAVVGFETLVRWRDSEGEIQSPLAFIGLATELGVIDPITHFVLAEAIRSIDLLDDAFGAGKAIAINVAAKQAGDLRFMRSFVDALEASGCADRFIVEVTEDAFIAKNQFQMQVLPMLRNVGARVSIDDFGTGYSSLSVLADITADEIKIDRSFITDIHRRPRSQSVLKAMESVSCALGMSVVAEGVETFEELAYLLGATGIRYAQGYHFARPFFLEEVAKTNGARGDERVISMERWRPESRPVAAARAAAGLRRD